MAEQRVGILVKRFDQIGKDGAVFSREQGLCPNPLRLGLLMDDQNLAELDRELVRFRIRIVWKLAAHPLWNMQHGRVDWILQA